MTSKSFNCASTILLIALLVGSNVFAETNSASTDDISNAVATINKVGANGEGHSEAVEAMRVLNQASADQIPLILAAMNDDNKLAINWLRSAVVTIAGDGKNFPVEKVKAYFEDRSGSHLGRLLAFDLLTDRNAGLKNQLVPTLVDDPSLPLRYMGVANLVKQAKEADSTLAIGLLGKALDKSRNVDQVISISKALDKNGIAVDLQKQLGFISSWNLVGNFDNTEEKGFTKIYGPENSLEEIDLDATYDDAKTDEKASWDSYNTTDPTGLVDLNKVVGKIKDTVVYAHANFDSPEDRTADIRIGCINAHKVWVNGTLVMANEIYHNGISPDKFIGQAALKKGSNEILVKVCQNNQTEPWAQRWQFQVRICDETGKALGKANDDNSEE